jgi:hypothetical protein
VGRRAPALARDDVDLLIERREVEPLHIRPHDPGAVVLGEQAVQIDRAQTDLRLIGLLEQICP